jgi:hypothetical protein
MPTCFSESSINSWIANNDGLDRDLYAKYWNTSDEYIDTLKELLVDIQTCIVCVDVLKYFECIS